MSLNDPFGGGHAKMLRDLQRRTRPQLDLASNALDHAASIKQMFDRIDGPARILKDLQRDPIRDTAVQLSQRFRDEDSLRATARAIAEAQRGRDLALRSIAGGELLRQHQLAMTAFDSGILRTAEIMARNSGTIASAIAATRRHDELAGLASSIVRQFDALRLVEMGRNAFPKYLAQQFAEQFSTMRDAAERIEAAETDEERVAILATLLTAMLAMLRAVARNTKRELLGAGLIMLFGLSADVNSFIPREPPPGMTPAQVQMLQETHRAADELRAEFRKFADSEHRLNEAYVSNMPRAELSRPAVIRAEPRKQGKTLWRAPADTLLAIAGKQGRWHLAIYRDPLTDELAQGWIYGNAVRMLDAR
ncbi:MAG: hypothetical protein E7773_14825 [Sphingomonas sp.]|uniref:hypothetical protein n=1 Tax=Sphingomonas sp. TaxID=28214 RepID=UPI001220FBDA|nr:hypothetical protein [Sphingomonas sp.]THD34460.1 MAG: hypothetical protein E7773_14825 [Sphingomonas sp.]